MKADTSVFFIALFGQFTTGYFYPSVDDKSSKDGKFNMFIKKNFKFGFL